MKRVSPEMLHFHNTPASIPGNSITDMSVLERQEARMKWQQQQEQQSFFNGNDHHFSAFIGNPVIKPDPGTQNGWPDFRGGGDQLGYGSGFDHMNQNTLSIVTTCSPSMTDQTILQRNSSSVSLSPKKRKTPEKKKPKVVSEENGMKQKIKGCIEEGDSTETSSKEKSKLTEVQKPDFIHVRARRGQATDSHSLAERVRREKISERMKYLQDLVPGCNKITGKAGMLDEIINYVQSLQRQVEFLSMKLATVHPTLDFDIDGLITKEMFVSSTGEFSAVGCSSEMANSAYFQLNSLLGMGTNPIDMQIQPTLTWDADLQNLYRMEFQQGTSTPPYKSQIFTGSDGGSNLKMEM